MARKVNFGVVGVLVVAAAATAVAVSLLTVGNSPTTGQSATGRGLPSARARVYANVSACLLTGPRGVADPAAAPVWAGMEDVSSSGRVRASYLQVTGVETEGNAQAFLGSLVVQGCNVILAVGGPEHAAALADAKRFPAVKFVVLGAGSGPANVTSLAFETSNMRTVVAHVVSAAVG